MYSPAKHSDQELLLDLIWAIKQLAQNTNNEELLQKYLAWYEDTKRDVAQKDYSKTDQIIFALENS